MRITGPCKLKRTTADSSNAIIQSFSSKWQQPLLRGRVGVVFRKNGPSFTPDLMYVYIAAPEKAIVARTPITKYTTMPLEEALLLADQGAIEATELATYAEPFKELVVMEIGQVARASKPITFKHLAENYNFYPSSTFIPLSQSGVDTLNKLGQFLDQ